VFYLSTKLLWSRNFAGPNAAIMNFPKYPTIASNDHRMYLFYSNGPRGIVAKGVIYSQIGMNLYNLAFGDWQQEGEKLDDFSRSNNGDRDKVLATVAFTAIDFTDNYPSAQIFAEGSTSARTRLYQMAISNNLLEIKLNFNILGSRNGSWEPFALNGNYEAFLIRRK
jgi:hypothetical protein